MIFLLLVLCNVALAIIFKYFDKYKVDNLNAIVVNYFTCVVSSSLYLGVQSVPVDFYIRPWFGSAIAMSLLFIIGFNLMALSYQRAGLTLTGIMHKMSLLISGAFPIIFYDELLTNHRLIGFVAAILTVILVNYPSKSDGFTLKNKWIMALPIIVFVMSGLIEIILFYVEVSGQVDGDGVLFTSTSFGLAGVIGVVIVFYRLLMGRSKFGLKDVFGGVILGLPNYLTIYLLIYLLEQGWDGSVLFPLNNVSILVTITLIGAIIYKEQLNLLKIVGLVFGIIAIVLIGTGI
jgi:drug/metabolite transporter (DMT)-like permease